MTQYTRKLEFDKGQLAENRKEAALMEGAEGSEVEEEGGSVDQWISGGGRSHGGAEARQATTRESDGGHKGQLPCFARCPCFAPGLLLCGR